MLARSTDLRSVVCPECPLTEMAAASSLADSLMSCPPLHTSALTGVTFADSLMSWSPPSDLGPGGLRVVHAEQPLPGLGSTLRVCSRTADWPGQERRGGPGHGQVRIEIIREPWRTLENLSIRCPTGKEGGPGPVFDSTSSTRCCSVGIGSLPPLFLAFCIPCSCDSLSG